MSLDVVDGKQYATATSLIIFPKDVATIPIPEPGHRRSSVELAYIERLIRKHAGLAPARVGR
jgi:hypothetical protein